jgi:hypothetical protein
MAGHVESGACLPHLPRHGRRRVANAASYQGIGPKPLLSYCYGPGSRQEIASLSRDISHYRGISYELSSRRRNPGARLVDEEHARECIVLCRSCKDFWPLPPYACLSVGHYVLRQLRNILLVGPYPRNFHVDARPRPHWRKQRACTQFPTGY